MTKVGVKETSDDRRDAGKRNIDGDWGDGGKHAGQSRCDDEQSSGRGKAGNKKSEAKSEEVCEAGEEGRAEGEEIGEEGRGEGKEDGEAFEEKAAAIGTRENRRSTSRRNGKLR